MDETQSLAAPPAVDVKAEAEPEPHLETAASPTDADAGKSKKKKKKKKKKSRRESLERTQSEIEEDAQQEPESPEPQDEKEEENQEPSVEDTKHAQQEQETPELKEEKDEEPPSTEAITEPSTEEKKESMELSNEEKKETLEEEQDNQAAASEDELAPPELERTSSLDSIKATGTRAVGSLFSRFKVGRKKPLPSRTESAAKLELVSPSPVKTAVKRLEVPEEKSLDDLPLRTKRDFFADGEQSVHVSAEKEKYDTLEKQRKAEKEAEEAAKAARQSPPSSRRSSDQVEAQDEAATAEASEKELGEASSAAPTSQSSDNVEKEESPAAVVNDVEATADALPASEGAPVVLEKSNSAAEEASQESIVKTQVSTQEITVSESLSTKLDVTDAASPVVTEEMTEEDTGATAVKETQPVSLQLDLDLEPAGETTETPRDQEEVVAPPPTDAQDPTAELADSVDTVQSEESELLSVKVTPSTSELPTEISKPAKPERMSPVKSLASRFEGKREQSLDSLKFRTVREFFPEERSIRVGAEKQKYEAQAQQQKLKAKAEEEAKSKYKIASSFKSPGKDGASPAPSPELKATAVNDSGVAVNHFNLSTPDAAGSRKKFSFDDGHAASDSPAKSSDGAPEAVTPVKSIASRFEGKREQSLDSLKFRTVREFFPEERSVRVGSEKQKFEAQAKQDNALDNLKFRTVREFFPDEGKRSIHVGAEKAKFEALTKQQEEAAKEAEKIKLKHAALSPNTSSTIVKSSEAAPNASHEDNQVDAGVGPLELKDSAAVEPTEGKTEIGDELDNHVLVSTANEPLESSEVSMTKAGDEGHSLPQTGNDDLTADPDDNKSDCSPVSDGQEGIGTNSGDANDGSDANKGITDENTIQSAVDQASVVEATIEQEEIEAYVPSAEHEPKEVGRSDPAESEENDTSIGDTSFGSGVEKNMPSSDDKPVNVGIGQPAQHEDNQTSVDEDIMEHGVEKEATASAELGIEETAQPLEKQLHVEAAVIEQEIAKETPSAADQLSDLGLDESVQPESIQALVDEVTVQDEEAPSSGNGPIELDLGESVQPEWNEALAANDNENNVSTAEDGRADDDLGEYVPLEVEHTEDDITNVAGDMVESSEETQESVEVVDEQVENAQFEFGVVEHADAVEVEATAIDTGENLDIIDAGADRSGEVVKQVASSDGLVELSLDEHETNQQADQEVAAPIANVDSSAEIEQVDIQSSEKALASQPDIAKDELSAENGLVELDLEKSTVAEVTAEPEQETKSTSRPMLTTERSFVLEDDNTIETEDTVVVGERPMTDSEDEFGPQSLTKARPADELVGGVSSFEVKQDLSSSSKTSILASKASPKLTRKVSAGSVGSARSSSSKTTVPVPMKRASITAPTASYMAKKAAEAEEQQQKASQQMKKKNSATKLKGTVSDTGFIKPPPTAPTVPVPMKRASITAPTASYMARKAAEAEEAHRASPPPKQISRQKTTVDRTGFKPPAAATTVPVPMKRASITAPTASWQARNVPGKSEASDSNPTARSHSSKMKGNAGPTVPVAPKRTSIMAPTASYMAKKAAEQTVDVAAAAASIPSRNKRYSNVKSKVMQGIQSGSMHAATHKTITKEEFIAAERRKSLGSAGVRSVLESFDRRASLSARVTIDGPPEPFVRSAVSQKKLNSTVPRYLDYENAPGYAERAQKQYERRKRLEEENAAKSERRQKELRVFFAERQQKALKFSAEEVRRGLEAQEFARLAKESELEIQKTLRKEKQQERAARSHTRGSSTASSAGASSSNGVTSRASKKSSKSSVSSVEEKIASAPAAELTALEPDTAIEVTVSVEETVVEKEVLPADEPVATVEASVQDDVAIEVQEAVVEATEVEEQTTFVSAVENDLALEQVAKKIDFDEASSDSDEKDTSTV